MHSKSPLNNNNDVEEVVIELNSDDLEKSLDYRDEGNMNVVVSLFAQENDEKRVIRFKKIPSSDTTKFNHNDHKTELMAFVNFEKLLQKYFENAEQFTVVPRIVFLDVDVQTLNGFLMRDRPVGRRDKVIGNNYGLLYRDVAFLPKEIYSGKRTNGQIKDSSTFCIEIKPKQGFFMETESEESDSECYKKCRFCYFQYSKLKNARIKSISQYCPLDLFSGHPEKMNRALKNLLENPQNNLKMFQDGKMIFNEWSRDTTSYRRALENLFPDILSGKKQETFFVNLIRKILSKDFKNCDNNVDICSALENADNIHERSCLSDSKSQLPSNSILRSVSQAQRLVKDNFERMEILDKVDESTHNASDKLILQNYKIGSTALDCSMMITFRRINEVECWDKIIDNNSYVRMKLSATSQQIFAVNATIVDLDLKKDSLAHFRKYRKQCQESKRAFAELLTKSSRENFPMLRV